MTLETLLIPTDGSEPAEAAADRAAELAEQLDATVHVLSVADSSLATGAGYAGASPGIRTRLGEQATRRADRLGSAVRERGLDVETAVREGIPAEQIVAYADEHGLDAIAMGTSGRGGVARAVVGSVADKVVRIAPVPVLTINRAAVDDGTRVASILLPTDGSALAEAGAKRGVELAAQLDATVHCVTVLESGVADEIEPKAPEDGPTERTVRATDAVDRIAATARERGLETVTATATGEPAGELIGYAEANDIDMIAMGTAGRGGFRRAVVGSVTDRLVRTAPVPVFSVRVPEEE